MASRSTTSACPTTFPIEHNLIVGVVPQGGAGHPGGSRLRVLLGSGLTCGHSGGIKSALLVTCLLLGAFIPKTEMEVMAPSAPAAERE